MSTDPGGRLEVLQARSSRLGNEARQMVAQLRRRPLLTADVLISALVNTAIGALVVTDLTTGQIIECNDQTQVLLGLPRERIVGSPPLTFVPARNREAVRAMLAQPMTEPYVTRVLRGDGTEIDVLVHGRTVREINGGIRVTQMAEVKGPRQCALYGECQLGDGKPRVGTE